MHPSCPFSQRVASIIEYIFKKKTRQEFFFQINGILCSLALLKHVELFMDEVENLLPIDEEIEFKRAKSKIHFTPEISIEA